MFSFCSSHTSTAQQVALLMVSMTIVAAGYTQLVNYLGQLVLGQPGQLG